MLVKTNNPKVNKRVEKGLNLRVDYYFQDNEEASDWIIENADEGKNMIVESFVKADRTIKFENCPYLIDSDACIYIDPDFQAILDEVNEK